METNRHHKIVYIAGAITLVVILASTIAAGKYPDYSDYVVWGVLIYAALLFVAAFFVIRKKTAA
jgi:hypothetical protein